MPFYSSTESVHVEDDGLMRSSNQTPYQLQSNNEERISPSPRETTWALTDFGQVGERSRDGSIHATDEVFNAASHLAATMLSILGTVLLISEASATQILEDGTELPPDAWKIVSFSMYGASLVFLFACSTAHHAIVGTWEPTLRMLDYLAIYPLIGGTFTPLCLVFFNHTVIGWAFCCTVWGIAILGMIATACCFHKIPKWFSMTMYITLGWLGAGMTYWLVPVLGWDGFGLFSLAESFIRPEAIFLLWRHQTLCQVDLDSTKYGTLQCFSLRQVIGL